MKKEDKKITATISADCAKKLNILKAHLDINTLSDVVRFVLEKNISAIVSKTISKSMKDMSGSNEEEVVNNS